MITTERLQLRQWKDSDAQPFCDLNADPDVMRYFPACYSREETLAHIQAMIDSINQKKFGFWAAELRETGEFIGFIGLWHQPLSTIPNTPFIEIGWRLAKCHWGKGLAPEGAMAALGYAFDQLAWPTVYAFTALPNQPSRRVMEKIGMTNTHQDFDHPRLPDNHPLQRHCLYAIDREAH